jgi:hypothetical protein
MFLSNKNAYYIFVSLILLISSCGYKELPTQKNVILPAVASEKEQYVYKKKDYVRFEYRGDKFRDPFVPLNIEGFASTNLSDEAIVPNISSLALKGIFDDSKLKIALISGGGVNYILKGSHLYDNRQRLVRGISGIIKKDSVIMIAPDKTTKELKLKQK